MTTPAQTTNAIVIANVTVTVVSDLHYTVKVEGERARTFKGESAWSDAQRYANDKLTEYHGYPTPGVFVL